LRNQVEVEVACRRHLVQDARREPSNSPKHLSEKFPLCAGALAFVPAWWRQEAEHHLGGLRTSRPNSDQPAARSVVHEEPVSGLDGKWEREIGGVSAERCNPAGFIFIEGQCSGS